MPEDRAPVLDNWIPRPGYVEVRRGHDVHCDDMGSAVVDSLMVYEGVTSGASKMFCATGAEIWDVSASGSGSDQSLGPFTSDRWQWVNFTTAAAKFLWIIHTITMVRPGPTSAHP
jgi:hypothetical protein